MVVLLLPNVFSTTAEIPRVRREGRRKGEKMEKGRERLRKEEGRVESEMCEYSHILLRMWFTSPSQLTHLTNSSHSPPHQLTPPHLTHSHTPLIT